MELILNMNIVLPLSILKYVKFVSFVRQIRVEQLAHAKRGANTGIDEQERRDLTSWSSQPGRGRQQTQGCRMLANCHMHEGRKSKEVTGPSLRDPKSSG